MLLFPSVALLTSPAVTFRTRPSKTVTAPLCGAALLTVPYLTKRRRPRPTTQPVPAAQRRARSLKLPPKTTTTTPVRASEPFAGAHLRFPPITFAVSSPNNVRTGSSRILLPTQLLCVAGRLLEHPATVTGHPCEIQRAVGRRASRPNPSGASRTP